jgi:hypothetical protein
MEAQHPGDGGASLFGDVPGVAKYPQSKGKIILRAKNSLIYFADP